MVFVAPFHHHDHDYQEDIHCDACSQHEPHPGHLNPKSGADECLICQFLGQQFCPQAGLDVDLSYSEPAPESGGFCDSFIPCFTSHTSSRAPPASFCI